jgi:capsular exopolysaccharide synthesis family protein
VNETNLTSLADYLGVLRRRWWILVLSTLIAAASGYLYSKAQSPEFAAKAVVRLSAQPISAQINPGGNQSATQTAVFVANEQAFAAAPTVVGPTVQALHLPLTNAQFLKRGSVSGDSGSGLLTFACNAASGPESETCATAWANQYMHAATKRDLAQIGQQLTPLLTQKKAAIKQIDSATTAGANAKAYTLGQQLKSLNDQIVKLQSLQTGVKGNRQLSAADTSTRVRPQTKRNVVAGAAVGLVIGLLLIGLLESLDTRVRRSDEFGAMLGLPLLSRIPTPTRAMRREQRLAMAGDDDPRYSEAYRRLRMNFDFANVKSQARTVMLTSALEQEGKSTTVANLAIAMAKAGRHVALVDLDLRRPILHRFFGLEGRPGIVDVAMNGAKVGPELYSVDIPEATGTLAVMPVGSMLSNPADFLESPAVDEILRQVADRVDVVLIDSAPMLPVSDSVALSAKVDGILVVIPAGAKRQVVGELHRTFDAGHTPLIGFILTSAEHETSGYYGGSYYYYTAHGRPSDAVAANAAAQPPAAPAGDDMRVDAAANGNGLAADTNGSGHTPHGDVVRSEFD